jgi:hypothetical protein
MTKIKLLFIIILIIFFIYIIKKNINENFENIQYSTLRDNIPTILSLDKYNDNQTQCIIENGKENCDSKIITFDKIINSNNIINSNFTNSLNDNFIKFDNINTYLKIPKISSNCYLVTKKYILDENNIPNFKYEFNNFKDDKCNYDLYNLNSNQQLLIDDENNKININLIGSCRYANKECIDFFDKKSCDKYDMIWSRKTCNDKLDFKPLQKCEDNYLFNTINNNCIKCPDNYTYVNNTCIKNSYIVNNYSMLNPIITPSLSLKELENILLNSSNSPSINNNIDYNNIINEINTNKNDINNVDDRLTLCNQENNNNCEIIDLNKVSVKCDNNDKRVGDYLCKPNNIEPDIKNLLDICPENYIKYNLGCLKP